jgi:hypothetical protein
LIKENHGFHEDNAIAEYMIPTTFNEETLVLSDNNLNSLKRHYMTFNWEVGKDLFDYIEDEMIYDSLNGSTISTRSKKSAFFANKISSSSVLSHDTNGIKGIRERQPT